MKIVEHEVVGAATTVVFENEDEIDTVIMERMCRSLQLAPYVGMNHVFIGKLQPGITYVCVSSPTFPKNLEEIMPGGKLRIAFRAPEVKHR